MPPAANARMRNSLRLNIGDSTRFSISTNATRNATPAVMPTITFGAVHPIE